MTEQRGAKHPQCELSKRVEARARLKRHAREHYFSGIWIGFGMAGMVGWSIALPAVLGTALGAWLDRHVPSTHSWTLMFLMTGLFIGCVNAAYWVSRENEAIRREKEREQRRHGDENDPE